MDTIKAWPLEAALLTPTLDTNWYNETGLKRSESVMAAAGQVLKSYHIKEELLKVVNYDASESLKVLGSHLVVSTVGMACRQRAFSRYSSFLPLPFSPECEITCERESGGAPRLRNVGRDIGK